MTDVMSRVAVHESSEKNGRKSGIHFNLRKNLYAPNFSRNPNVYGLESAKPDLQSTLTFMDWSPRSRTSNPRSRSPGVIPRPVDYG